MGLFEGIDTQRLESVAQIRQRARLDFFRFAQRLIMKRALFGEQFLDSRPIRVGRSARRAHVRQLIAKRNQFSFLLRGLQSQLLFEAMVLFLRGGRLASRTDQPSDGEKEPAADDEPDHQIHFARHT